MLTASSEQRQIWGECWKNFNRKQRARVFVNSELREFERLNDAVNWTWDDDISLDNQVRLGRAMESLGIKCFD